MIIAHLRVRILSPRSLRQDENCAAANSTARARAQRGGEAIRKGLRERGVLPAEGTRVQVHESLRWTNQQKRQCQVVTFAAERNRPAPSATVVRVERKKVVVALATRKEIVLDLCFTTDSLLP
jgi:hypothetical protein